MRNSALNCKMRDRKTVFLLNSTNESDQALEFLPGISSKEMVADNVFISYDDTILNDRDLIEALHGYGLLVAPQSVRLYVNRIIDSASLITLRSFKGIQSVQVDNCIIQVVYDVDVTDLQQIIKMIGNAGYSVSLKSLAGLPTPEVSPLRPIKKTISVDINGMVCQSCVNSIQKSLEEFMDVSDMDISLSSNTGTFTFDTSKVSEALIISTIEECGFDASIQGTKFVKSPGFEFNNSNSQDIEMKTLRRKRSTITAESSICIFNVNGMFCGSCVSSIEKSLRQTDGILGVSVSLLAQSAEVRYNGLLICPDQIVDKIEEIGFEAKVMKEDSKKSVCLRIFGMTCASCSASIERELSKVPGIKKVSVNLLGQSGVFEYDKSKIGIRKIISHIEDIGFDAVVDNADPSAQLESLQRTKEILKWKHTFFMSCVWGIPVAFITMILPMLISADSYNYTLISGLRLIDVILVLLTLPIQFGVGRVFFEAASKSVRHRVYTMVRLLFF